MSTGRRIAGVLALIAAFVVVLAGYASVPSAYACNVVNSMDVQLGNPPSCSTTPAAGYFVAAILLALVSLLCFAPALLRWITGK